MACLLLSAVASCSGGPVNSFCDIDRPVYIGEGDTLTDETVRQILTHNEVWAKLCESDE